MKAIEIFLLFFNTFDILEQVPGGIVDLIHIIFFEFKFYFNISSKKESKYFKSESPFLLDGVPTHTKITSEFKITFFILSNIRKFLSSFLFK